MCTGCAIRAEMAREALKPAPRLGPEWFGESVPAEASPRRLEWLPWTWPTVRPGFGAFAYFPAPIQWSLRVSGLGGGLPSPHLGRWYRTVYIFCISQELQI